MDIYSECRNIEPILVDEIKNLDGFDFKYKIVYETNKGGRFCYHKNSLDNVLNIFSDARIIEIHESRKTIRNALPNF